MLRNNQYKKKTIKKRPKQVRFIIRKFLPYIKFSLIGLALILFMLFVYFFLFQSSFFKIDSVRVYGTKSFVNQADLSEVVRGKVYGKSIFSFDVSTLEKTLKDNFLGAKNIKVYKVYPTTISVEVMERVPLAVVYKNGSDEYFMVDDDGYVLGFVEPERTNLPRISYEGEIKIGDFVDSRMVPVYLELVNALSDQELKVSSMSFYPKYAQLFINDGVETLVSNEKNRYESISILSALLKQLQLEGKKAKKVDLRYDKVIVSYD